MADRSVKFDLTLNDCVLEQMRVLHGLNVIAKQRRSFFQAAIFLFVVAGGALVIAELNRGKPALGWLALALFTLSFGITFSILAVLQAHQSRYRLIHFYQKPKMRWHLGPQNIVLTDSGIRIERHLGITFIPWWTVEDVQSDTEYIYVSLLSGSFVIPYRAFPTPQEKEEVLETLRLEMERHRLSEGVPPPLAG